MKGPRGPVERFRLTDDLLGFLVGDLSRISQARSEILVPIEVGDCLIIRDGYENHLPPLLGQAQGEYADPGRSIRHSPQVTMDLVRIAEHVGCTGYMSEIVKRCGN